MVLPLEVPTLHLFAVVCTAGQGKHGVTCNESQEPPATASVVSTGGERTNTRMLINIGTVDLELLRTTNEPTGAVLAGLLC